MVMTVAVPTAVDALIVAAPTLVWGVASSPKLNRAKAVDTPGAALSLRFEEVLPQSPPVVRLVRFVSV
ncbi:hypothetical protein GSbR_30700 [Geobacter sp. SVR]|nr:hypothetical protein GSVR_30300 [Geobacter sp. SVR]GCF86470.1 hypothetical protein GSbR_30700 [Geobacter sp. SVR]